jgi:hypothetical protein
MKKVTLPWLTWTLFALVLLVRSLVRAEPEPARGYETSHATVQKIARELHEALEPAVRGRVQPGVAYLEQMPAPYLQPVLMQAGDKPCRTVAVSAGLVDLLNALTHAKALDEIERGFYRKFLATLATPAGTGGPPAVRPGTPQTAWGFDTMNHQTSLFNQMAGTLVAIKMAHHYLGHYERYAARLGPGTSPDTSINALLTPEEWKEAVLRGARNALDCGYGVDGFKTLCEALAQMPSRPDWALQFLPANADVGRMKKDLDKLEKRFFAGN